MSTEHRSIGLRLRASRLRAGFASASDAIAGLGVGHPAYRAAEAGRRRPSADLLAQSEKAFGVSSGFVVDGRASTEAEAEAGHLSAILERATSAAWSGDGDAAHRLRKARRSVGLRSAAATAVAHGWKLSTYQAHDSGTRPVPLDRMISYALALEARPEYLLFDEGPVRRTSVAQQKTGEVVAAMVSREASAMGSIDLERSDDDDRVAVSASWPWLSGQDRGSFLELPVLARTRSRSFRVLTTPLVLPTMPNEVRAGDRARLFVLADEDGLTASSVRLRILRQWTPGEAPDDLLVCDGRGIDRSKSQSDRLVHEDPVTFPGTSADQVVLGCEVGRMTIEWLGRETRR